MSETYNHICPFGGMCPHPPPCGEHSKLIDPVNLDNWDFSDCDADFISNFKGHNKLYWYGRLIENNIDLGEIGLAAKIALKCMNISIPTYIAVETKTNSSPRQLALIDGDDGHEKQKPKRARRKGQPSDSGHT